MRMAHQPGALPKLQGKSREMKCVLRAAKTLTVLCFGWAISASAENDWIEVKGGSWVPGSLVLSERSTRQEWRLARDNPIGFFMKQVHRIRFTI